MLNMEEQRNVEHRRTKCGKGKNNVLWKREEQRNEEKEETLNMEKG